MNLTIQLTAEDYVQAFYLHLRPRPVLKWIGCFLILLAVIVDALSFCLAAAGHENFILPASIAAILAYFAFMFLFYYPRRWRKIFSQQKAAHLPNTVVFTDEGMQAKTDIANANLPWNYFSKWKENKNLFIIYQSDAMFHIFPKRCFHSPEETMQFRQMLQTKLGNARP